MTTPTPTDFEDQLTRALRHRAAPVTADDGARVAIDRRIAQRTRARRTRRVGLAAVAVIVLLAGAFAVSQRGHDDASVVTGPDTPAVHLPQLGLPPELGTNRIVDYSPGRSVSVVLLTGVTSTTSQIQTGRSSTVTESRTASSGGHVELQVTDASIADIARTSPESEQPIAVTVRGGQGLWVASVSGGTGSAGVLMWQAAPSVVATLAMAPSPDDGDPQAAAISRADGLVELDDAAWWQVLNPDPSITPLGMTAPTAYTEISSYTPHIPAGSLLQVFDVPGHPPGTFELAATPTATPDIFDAVDDPDHVDVRGTSGLVGAAPGYLTTAYGYTRSLSWAEGERLYRLDFTDAATIDDAVQVAEELAALSPDQWHALLFPTTLRIDLVPMPQFGPAVESPPEGPSGSTLLTVPSSPTSATTTGG